MPNPNALKKMSERVGEDPETVIPRIVNELGSQKEAAKALKVSEMTISNWLKNNGYTVKKQWVKCDSVSA